MWSTKHSTFIDMLSILLLFSLVQVLYTYKRNPRRNRTSPLEACESLNPFPKIPTQTITFPFDIIVEPTDPYIGEKVTVTIKGKQSKKLGGFMVQARQDFKTPFGTFNSSDHGKDVKYINCRSPATTITHRKFNPRSNVALTWTPPAQYKGPAVFYVTVIKGRKVIWVAQKSEPCWFMKTRPPPFQLEQF